MSLFFSSFTTYWILDTSTELASLQESWHLFGTAWYMNYLCRTFNETAAVNYIFPFL